MFVSSKVSMLMPILLSSVTSRFEMGGVPGFSGREASATEIELESV